MAEISNNGLFCIKEKIRNFYSFQGASNFMNVIVLELHRYTVDNRDPHFAQCSESDLFDITFCDKEEKYKCLVDPSLNSMIHTNKVYPGCVVAIDIGKCEVRYDETDINSSSLVVIGDLNIVGFFTGLLKIEEYSRNSSEKERSDVPLTTQRGSYLPAYCNEDPGTAFFCVQDLPNGPEIQDYNHVGSVSKLNDHWKRKRRKDYEPLVVRVLHRARLRYYGTPKRSDKWPYQAYIQIADESGHCTLVLWNAICKEFYTRLREGVVIYIKDYTVRERFHLMSTPSVRDSNMPFYNIEISINKHHPIGFLKILRPRSIPGQFSLPQLKYHFLCRKDISSLPDGYNLDIVGVVSYVGRQQRLRKDREHGGFWLYRWVELVDGSSPQNIRIEIFATSQPYEHSSIRPGCLLVCTQMRLVHHLQVTTQGCNRVIYATTTNESQVYVHDISNIKGPYKNDSTLKEVVWWCRSTRAHLNPGTIGGYYVFPPLVQSLTEYKAHFKKEADFKVLSTDQLLTEVQSLHYREFKRVQFQGFIVHVRIVRQNGRENYSQVRSQRSNSTSSYISTITISSETSHTDQTNNSSYRKRLRSHSTDSRTSTGTRNTRSKSKESSKRSGTGLRRKGSVEDSDDSLSRGLKKTRLDHDFQPGTSTQYTKADDGITIDGIYRRLLTKVPVVGSIDIDPDFFVRQYRDEADLGVLQDHVNIPPSVFDGTEKENRQLQDLPISTDHDTCLMVTIKGLNENILMNTVLQVPKNIAENTTFTQLLCGGHNCDTANRDIDTGANEKLLHRLLESAVRVKNKRLLFVLDLYSYGSERTEVTLNRGFKILM